MTKAIIAGGGIGGLTAAVALRRAGVEVAVFERAPEIEEIGAGITQWANAPRLLKRLGVYDEIRSSGAAEIGGELRSLRGEMISEMPLLCCLRDVVARRTSAASAQLCQYEEIARYDA